MQYMPRRSVWKVVLLFCFTGGIYPLYWLVTTKDEMNRQLGENLPTGWCLIVPLLNFWWLWRWCGGVEKMTRGRLPQAVCFLMCWLSVIGAAIVQNAFNQAIDEDVRLPMARVA